MKTKHFLACLALLTAYTVAATAQNITTTNKIIDNGPDGTKLVFAVIGDGYSAGEMTKYREDVDRLVVNGVFAHDFFRDNRTAFNVYRVEQASTESGVSKPGVPKRTALKVLYTGKWKRCWMEPTSNTDVLITEALKALPKYNFVLVMVNEGGFGGCRRGSRLYVTRSVNWDVVAHEYGHGVGNLYDEYWQAGAGSYAGPAVNLGNCSTVLNRNSVVWNTFIGATLALPTSLANGINPNTTVGMFPGCMYRSAGIYRPVDNCRMRTNSQDFCPVCLALLRKAVGPFLTAPPGGSLAAVAPDSVNLVVRVTDSGSAVVDIQAVEGNVSQPAQPSGDFVLEVARALQPSEVSFVPEDPLLIRGFADPKGEPFELIERGESATIVVSAPRVSVADLAEGNVTLRLYKLSAAAGELPAVPIDAAILSRLKAQNLVAKQFEVSPDKLRSAAKREGLLRER